MAFSYQGPGTWGITAGNSGKTLFRLPEFGITEKLFNGNQNSVAQANARRDNLSYTPNISSNVNDRNGRVSGVSNSQPNYSEKNYSSVYDKGGNSKPQAESFSGGSRRDDNNFDSFRPGGGYNKEVNSEEDYQDYLDWVEDQQRQYMRDVENTFNEGNQYLNQSEQSLRAGKDDFINQFTGQFEAQKPLLGQARDEGLAQVDQNRANERERERSALGAARQLYNELSQAGRARFGSGALSSAGQAQTELLGRETAKNFGDVREATGQTMRKLEDSAMNIEREYSAKLQAVEAQLQSAIAQAQDEFRRRLDAINNQRFQLAQNKAMAKLDALRELRNQTYAQQAQATQYKQQLGLMREQQTLNIQSAIAQMQEQARLNGIYTPSSYSIGASMFSDAPNPAMMNPTYMATGSFGLREEDQQ